MRNHELFLSAIREVNFILVLEIIVASNCLALNLKGDAVVIKQHFMMSIMGAFLKLLSSDKREDIFSKMSQFRAFRNATEISAA